MNFDCFSDEMRLCTRRTLCSQVTTTTTPSSPHKSNWNRIPQLKRFVFIWNLYLFFFRFLVCFCTAKKSDDDDKRSYFFYFFQFLHSTCSRTLNLETDTERVDVYFHSEIFCLHNKPKSTENELCVYYVRFSVTLSLSYSLSVSLSLCVIIE